METLEVSQAKSESQLILKPPNILWVRLRAFDRRHGSFRDDGGCLCGAALEDTAQVCHAEAAGVEAATKIRSE